MISLKRHTKGMWVVTPLAGGRYEFENKPTAESFVKEEAKRCMCSYRIYTGKRFSIHDEFDIGKRIDAFVSSMKITADALQKVAIMIKNHVYNDEAYNILNGVTRD